MNDKQYLPLLNEANMSMLGALCPGLRFVQIGGMEVPGDENNMVLVTPKPPPLVADPAPSEDNAVG